MAQRILLSARYRDLPIARIARLSQAEAYAIFRKARWPETAGEAVCPKCGSEAWTLGHHALAGDKRQFRCKEKYYHQVNERADRVDLRKLGDITGKKMAIVVARERSTADRVGLSVCTVVPHEADSRPWVFDSVDRMATVHADDASHWDALRVALNVDQVNHSQRYFDKGVCTNQGESYFSRVGRMEMGTHHHIAGPYLWGYGCDAVWREDHRRETQAEKFDDLLRALLSNTVSRTMKGYWQRHLETIPDASGLRDALVDGDHDADAIAVAKQAAADEGRMSREDVVKAFGSVAADGVFGPNRRSVTRKWKPRAPYAPKLPSTRPEPWSELKKPLGLPSFIP